MAPSTERLLRISVAHYRNESVSEADFHRWATEDHCARAAAIHAKHKVEAFGMFFSPKSVQDAGQKLNLRLGGRWAIDDHDVRVEFYLRDLESLISMVEDPDFKALQEEEAPYVSSTRQIVASVGWVEVYVEHGKVVHLGLDGKPTYPDFQVSSVVTSSF